MINKSFRGYRLSPATDMALRRLRTLLRAAQDGRRVTWNAAIGHAARLAEDDLRARLIGRGIDPETVTAPERPARSDWLGMEEFMRPEVDD